MAKGLIMGAIWSVLLIIVFGGLGLIGYWFVTDTLMNWSNLAPVEKGTAMTVLGATVFVILTALAGAAGALDGKKKEESQEIPDFSKEPPSLGDAKPGRARRVQWL